MIFSKTSSVSISNFGSIDILHAAMVFGLIVPQFLSTSFDRAVKVKTNNGIVWVSLNDSNLRKFVLALILVIIGLNLTFALIENLTTPNSSLIPLRVVAAIATTYILLNYRLTTSGWELHQVSAAVVFWLYFIISDFKKISTWLTKYLKFLIVSAFAVNVFFSLFNSNYGRYSCRSDKCGIFGNLWTGFFPHENAFAFFTLTSATLYFIFLRKWSQNLFLILCLILILASGSRMALLGFVIFGLCRFMKDTLLSLLPLFLALIATVFFAANTSTQFLTGRGGIWNKIKSQLDSTSWIYGQGMTSFQTGKSKELFGYALYDEQGTLASQFNRYGIIGVLIFLAFLVAYFICRNEISRTGKTMLVVLSFAMITESFAVPSVSNFYCFLYFIAICAPDLGKERIAGDSIQVYR